MKISFQLFLIIAFSYLLLSCSSTQTIINKEKLAKDFSDKEKELISKEDGSKPMRVYTIDNPTDSILLNTKSERVLVNKNSTLKKLVDRLYATVTDSSSLGVGIAAPQVGVLRKIIWVQRFDKEGAPFEVYLNPQIIQYSKKKQKQTEGCLSVPNRYDELNVRSYAILIEYDTMDNKHKVEMVEDFTAVIFQHEIDHLQGIIYTEYLVN